MRRDESGTEESGKFGFPNKLSESWLCLLPGGVVLQWPSSRREHRLGSVLHRHGSNRLAPFVPALSRPGINAWGFIHHL